MSAVVAHDHVKQKGGEERVALHILDGLSAERLVTSLAWEVVNFLKNRIADSATDLAPSDSKRMNDAEMPAAKAARNE